ncbi:MAG: TlpA disulfide reductase family protein [Dyadobacter sp.]|uniref:TlpA family protein disulfide reductase n=1 Tax=Dyadobacter sp. TaxID=1914288 RepID=UPI0032670CE1
MKRIILSSLACFATCCTLAQKPGLPKESPSNYYNNFQKFTNEKPDVDSAFYNIRKLASNAAYANQATDLIHNSFAQDFMEANEDDPSRLAMRVKRRLLATEILNKMIADTSATMKRHVQSLYIFTKIQKAGTNKGLLGKLTTQFITSEIDGRDIYQNRAGRYGLMILSITSKYPELKAQSAQLSDKLLAKLKAGQVTVTDSSSRSDLDMRAWYRFLNAYVNFKKSEETADRKQKENLLKAAFDYSPDLVDKNHKSGYFYDMHMLLGEAKDGFQDDYLTFVTANSDRQQVMATLLKMALVEPTYKENLRVMHKEVMPGDSFNAYWKKGIDDGSVNAPPISLHALDKTSFSSKSLSGQWILVDFWGTWCGPCREEHPALQKFYESTIVEKSKKLSVLTVACRDTESKVTAYMSKNNYNFPVAMSDSKIEKSFKVQGYPTKVLITPTGRYITVPFGVDWVAFVNKYVEAD